MDFKDRVVVITGATGGLGRVAARQFGQAGARLALFSTNEDNLRALSAELALPPEQVMTAALNFIDPLAGEQALEKTLERFSQADILLHLVGGWVGGKPLVEVTPGQVESMLNQHVWSTFYLARAFLPHFLARSWGRLLIISSPNAGIPRAKSAPYAAAKAAQENLLLTIAQEVKGSGVTANILRVSTIDVQHERLHHPSRENAAWTTPEEICAAMFYLCSPQAEQVNGAILPLYGAP